MSMSLIKSADKTKVSNSDIITYSIVLKNNENERVTNVEVTDCIPNCTKLVSNSVTLNGVSISDQSLVMGIQIPVLQVGESSTIAFKVQVSDTCESCSIVNTANVAYVLGTTLKFLESNKLSIDYNCNNNSCNQLQNLYVIPGVGGASEVVLMTDEELAGGIMTLPGNTLSMSADAINLLNNAFFESYPAKVSDLNPSNNYYISSLLVSLNDAGIITLTQTPPEETDRIEYNVNVGDIINQPSSSCPCASMLEPIAAPYAGRVICINLGYIRIYIYFSSVLLRNISCGGTTNKGYSAIATKGEFGVSVYPKPIVGAIGTNCSACGVCGICGACGLCGPTVILGAASSALISAIAISASISAFTTKM